VELTPVGRQLRDDLEPAWQAVAAELFGRRHPDCEVHVPRCANRA
jgi:hypothetical protein